MKKLVAIVTIVAFVAGGLGGLTVGKLTGATSTTTSTSDIYGSRTDGVIYARLDEDGTLTFSGDGAIESTIVWLGLSSVERHQVKRIVIGEGITSIGDFEFSGGSVPNYPNLEEVVIDGDLSKIGYCAFWSNPNLRTVTMNGSCAALDKTAFDNCPSLEMNF